MKKLFLFFGWIFLSTHLLFAQTLSPKEIKYLDKKLIDLNVDATYRKANWEGVLKKVKDKRIVLLGEFTHGAKEVFTTRNDLIKALHEKQGFNVLLFESGLGEIAAIEFQKENLNPQQLTSGFFGPWRNKPFRDLMTYAQQNKIAISGFDVQRTGKSFKALLFEVAQKQGLTDTSLINSIENRYGIIQRIISNRKSSFEQVQAQTTKLIEDYEKIIFQLMNNEPLRKDPKFSITIKTLENRTAYLSYMLQWVDNKNWNQRWKMRDSLMADNVSWLIKNFYTDQKLIIIGHNFHIAKYNEQEEVMGEFLQKEYADQMYAIGVFAGKGTYANNAGRVETLLDVDATTIDLKMIIQNMGKSLSFLEIPKSNTPKTSWLFKPLTIKDTFINLSGGNKMILSKHFDGLLFLDKVSPARK